MKKLISKPINQSILKALLSILFVSFLINANAQIAVDSYGDVTLADEVVFNDYQGFCYIEPLVTNGASLGEAGLKFYQIHVTSVVEGSDSRIKENIQDVSNALDIVTKLQAVKYDLKKNFLYDEAKTSKHTKDKFEKERKNKIGFIAQDVEKIIPELVVYDDSSDMYGITYSRFIPILSEAIKEQQYIIEDLITRIEQLEKNSTKEKSASLNETNDTPTLAQNIPNPFSLNTRIDIYLPESISNANLYIYNMQGAQINEYSIQERGNSSIIVEGFTLDAGLYLYTLIADGKEVDTKKMILTN